MSNNVKRAKLEVIERYKEFRLSKVKEQEMENKNTAL